MFNRVNTLERATRSVLLQLRPGDELLLVDDHSSDGSYGMAQRLADSDRRIRVMVNARRKGAPGARNTGLFAATEEWVVFLDSDDEWLPDFRNRLIEQILDDEAPDIVTCHTQVVEGAETGKPQFLHTFSWCASGDIQHDLLTGSCYVDMNGAMIRRQKLVAIGGLDEACPSFQEWDLHIRLSANCRYRCVPDVLVYYHQHAGQMSKNSFKTVDGFLYVLKKHQSLWKSLAGLPSWSRRCDELQNMIDGLPNNRGRYLLRIWALNPRRAFYRGLRWAKRFLKSCPIPRIKSKNEQTRKMGERER